MFQIFNGVRFFITIDMEQKQLGQESIMQKQLCN